MPKVTITTLANLDNPTSATSTINANFLAVQTIIDSLVSRDGTSPNSMTASLDMNDNRILNLPAPVADEEPARKVDIGNAVAAAATATASATTATNAATTATGAASTATTQASAAAASASAASDSADEAASVVSTTLPNLGVFDISIFAGGALGADEVIIRMVAGHAFTVESAGGTVANAAVAATAETELSLQKNDVEFGTLTWASSGTVATVAIGADTDFEVGDVLSVVAPSSADDTLADVAITVVAAREV